jgi:hypothetical protein
MPKIKSGEIAKKLAIPSPTIKRILTNLMANYLKNGSGVGTNTNTISIKFRH